MLLDYYNGDINNGIAPCCFVDCRKLVIAVVMAFLISALLLADLASVTAQAPVQHTKRQAPAGVPDFVVDYGKSIAFEGPTLCQKKKCPRM